MKVCGFFFIFQKNKCVSIWGSADDDAVKLPFVTAVSERLSHSLNLFGFSILCCFLQFLNLVGFALNFNLVNIISAGGVFMIHDPSSNGTSSSGGKYH